MPMPRTAGRCPLYPSPHGAKPASQPYTFPCCGVQRTPEYSLFLSLCGAAPLPPLVRDDGSAPFRREPGRGPRSSVLPIFQEKKGSFRGPLLGVKEVGVSRTICEAASSRYFVMMTPRRSRNPTSPINGSYQPFPARLLNWDDIYSRRESSRTLHNTHTTSTSKVNHSQQNKHTSSNCQACQRKPRLISAMVHPSPSQPVQTGATSPLPPTTELPFIAFQGGFRPNPRFRPRRETTGPGSWRPRRSLQT